MVIVDSTKLSHLFSLFRRKWFFERLRFLYRGTIFVWPCFTICLISRWFVVGINSLLACYLLLLLLLVSVSGRIKLFVRPRFIFINRDEIVIWTWFFISCNFKLFYSSFKFLICMKRSYSISVIASYIIFLNDWEEAHFLDICWLYFISTTVAEVYRILYNSKVFRSSFQFVICIKRSFQCYLRHFVVYNSLNDKDT